MNPGRKATGQAWLGEVPSHWELRPLGTAFRERKTTVSDTNFEPLSVSMAGIVPRMDGVALTDNNDSRKLVRAGDYVINSRSDRKGSGGISSSDGSVSVISIVLRPMGIETRYAHHLLRSVAFQEEFYRWGNGIVADLWSTRFAAMRRITLPVPPPPEQIAIADFLDRETDQIDALVAAQRELVGLLKERRSAVIGASVRGLDSAVPWAAASLRRVTRITLGKMVQPEPSSDLDVEAPYLRAAHVQPNGRLIDVDDKQMWFSPRELRALKLEPGDVAVVEGGAGFGRSTIIPSGYECWGFQNSILRLRPNPGMSEARFISYALQDLLASGETSLAASVATIPHFTAEKIAAVVLPMPDADEQTAIADHLDRETAQMDAMIEAANESIAFMLERRSALISAAVTGRIDPTTGKEAS